MGKRKLSSIGIIVREFFGKKNEKIITNTYNPQHPARQKAIRILERLGMI